MKNQNTENPIFGKLDHTVLSIDTTASDIDKAAAEALKYNVASLCVPPCYVAYARKLVGHKMRITTVISFPSGNSTTDTKVFECKDAIKNGADELDVVVNIGQVKKRQYAEIEKELATLRHACKNKILKIIIETPLLTPEEQVAMCTMATSAKIDYVKTCTGFNGAATESDVKRLAGSIGDNVKVKASGGIKSLADAEKFVLLGADRIGESGVIASVEEEK